MFLLSIQLIQIKGQGH